MSWYVAYKGNKCIQKKWSLLLNFLTITELCTMWNSCLICLWLHIDTFSDSNLLVTSCYGVPLELTHIVPVRIIPAWCNSSARGSSEIVSIRMVPFLSCFCCWVLTFWRPVCHHPQEKWLNSGLLPTARLFDASVNQSTTTWCYYPKNENGISYKRP